MFLRGLKEKSAYKFLKKRLTEGVPPSGLSRRGIRTIGCIVDTDIFPNTEVFYDLSKEFNLRSNVVKIIGYKSKLDKISPYSIPMFCDKDLGWNGAINSGYTLEFLERDFDLLINYYNEEKLPLMLASVQSKARLKVGFSSVDNELNDLILTIEPKNFNAFKSELKKYLTILKEI